LPAKPLSHPDSALIDSKYNGVLFD
jgi:hypothetical protein